MGKPITWTPEDYIAMHDVSRALARGDRAKARALLRKRYGQELGEAIYQDDCFRGLAANPGKGQRRNERASRADQEPTAREIEVLSGAADGLSNEEIGRKLFLAAETVKTHKQRIFLKLRARNIGHAIAIAYERGLIKRKGHE